MLHRILFTISVCAALAVPIQAQAFSDPPKVSLFGGYSYGRSEGDINWNGFNIEVTGNLTRHFGITGEVSGLWADLPVVDVSFYNFAIGPRISSGTHNRVRSFAHALVGAGRLEAGALGVSDSRTSFSTTFGGGIDIGVTRGFAIRVIQADWVRVWDIEGDNGDLARLSFGVVGRF